MRFDDLIEAAAVADRWHAAFPDALAAIEAQGAAAVRLGAFARAASAAEALAALEPDHAGAIELRERAAEKLGR
jgi:hypothetical protein